MCRTESCVIQWPGAVPRDYEQFHQDADGVDIANNGLRAAIKEGKHARHPNDETE